MLLERTAEEKVGRAFPLHIKNHESSPYNGEHVCLNLVTASMLIEAWAETLLIDFLILLKHVNEIIWILENFFLETFNQQQGTET